MNLTWQECLEAPETVDVDSLRSQLLAAIASSYSTTNLSKLRSKVGAVEITHFLNSAVGLHCGTWARWWSFSGGDGGFVSSWCCPNHSALLKNDRSIDDTIERVVLSVVEWHDAIRFFENQFATLAEETEGMPLADRVEHAAVQIAHELILINSARDAWYYTFQSVLEWYLSSLGLEPIAINEELERVVEGRFSSWTEPSSEELRQTAKEIGDVVQGLETSLTNNEFSDNRIDTTAQWLKRRKELERELGFQQKKKITRDEHRAFIERFDFERSQTRGEAMLNALAQCRADAKSDRPLDWEMLRQWQELVLQREAAFRTGDAFAKGGRERYPLNPGTPKDFRKRLAEANADDVSPLTAAGRVYFDVCFFHPFNDGNARSARLAFEFVLARNNLAFELPDLLFRVSRDPHCGGFFAALQAVLGQRVF